ncbi:type II toxin-antitoxin system VapC family toxin [Silvibacterium dinghuense]|uniref:PIN domain-containing protein n=1 Tax=Silvibacterium dinghuense TaxID=1560006 RepID=A0A4Q1S8Q7_9BACT|nr:type II toxin-antitoxin system VapC family toxin [Silvibacterium dinghuense]RXS93380.1 PIN domain-containing protein [Silvibacterium dinghuense]GGH05352.1 DNA-binding protein [Silvibacterium dinghuense]
MKINADTNVLLRLFLQDDPAQEEISLRLMKDAEEIFMTVPALCEVAWVVSKGYKLPRHVLIAFFETLLHTRGVVMDERAVQSGIEMLKAGGDFADGAIADLGYQRGATFVSFDLQAVARLKAMKLPAMLAE